MDNNFFKWQPEKFSIGVGLMDSEHERLISIMNNLHHKFLNNESKSELMKVIKQLGDFVVMHFKHEEEYFMKIPSYIYKDAHKSLHTQLINKFTNHVNAFEKNGVLKEDFFDFLKLWLTGHIIGIDMNYGKGLKK